MNQQNKVIPVQAELRRLDLSKIPQEFKCPNCGDILRALMHISFEGSPVLYCEKCSSNGQGYLYYYLAPKGLLV